MGADWPTSEKVPELEAMSAQMTMMVNVRLHAFSVPPGGAAQLGTLADADRSRTRQLPLSAVSGSSYKSETFAFSHTGGGDSSVVRAPDS